MNRILIKIAIPFTFAISLTAGIFAAPTVASAWNGDWGCPAATGGCNCGSADINPTTNEAVLPEGDWGDDCNDLAAVCDRMGCEYDPVGFGGGNCTCN